MLVFTLFSPTFKQQRSFKPMRIAVCRWMGMAALLMSLILAHVANAQTSTAEIDELTSLKLQSRYQKELDKWMLQAYEGDRDAQFKVGVLFTNNQFNSADFEQAVYWYRQAARQGHSLAQYNLGHQYLTGVGIKRSETEAMKWWLKAAQQDHPLAQFNVGRGYYLGIGLSKDHSQSQYWFKRAAQNQEPKSIEILEQLGWAKPGEYLAAGESGSAVNPVDETPAIIATATDNKLNENSSSEVINQATEPDIEEETTPESETQGSPIAAYTNPAKRSVLIGIVNSRDTLRVVSRTPEWAIVTNDQGFPVWVSQTFFTANGKTGTVMGNMVNARSVPLVANGTIVGQLDKGEKLEIIDNQKGWYRVISPARFKAWVKTTDLDRTIKPVDETGSELASNKWKTNPNANTAEAKADEIAKPVIETAGSVDDNAWLFSQPADGYTLQLASFDDPEKIALFLSQQKFANKQDLHRFNSESKDITWTYFLYGAFNSGAAAKIKRDEIKQKRAWVRSFGKLQQNRCLAWKKQIPTPKELNRYCS